MAVIDKSDLKLVTGVGQLVYLIYDSNSELYYEQGGIMYTLSKITVMSMTLGTILDDILNKTLYFRDTWS